MGAVCTYPVRTYPQQKLPNEPIRRLLNNPLLAHEMNFPEFGFDLHEFPSIGEKLIKRTYQ